MWARVEIEKRVRGQEPGHGVAVLLVMEGDTLDDAFQRVERRACLGDNG